MQEAASKADWRGRELRTFETLPRVGAGPPAARASALWAKPPSLRPRPRRPFSGRGRRAQGRGWVPPRPLNFRRTPGAGRERGTPTQGKRAFGRQRLRSRAGGAWVGASGVFVRTRAPHVCGSLWICGRGRAAAGAFVCPRLCVAAPHPYPRLRACVWRRVSVGASRVSAYVVGACRRVWAGCPRRVCAPRGRRRPTSPLPRCPPGPLTWLQTFLPVPRATAPVLPTAARPGAQAGRPSPSLSPSPSPS
nr:uncharacterized protein LOC120360962 [Saimiri boliviensis boliviensis]